MKRWMIVVLSGFITVGSVSAAIWPFGSKEKKETPSAVNPQVKPGEMHRKSPQGFRDRMQRRHPEIREEQRARMKANFKEIQKLVAAARAETDPAKKSERIGQLREKLSEGADRMLAGFSQRLNRAEAEVEKMKQRLAEEVKNKDRKVDEQLQRLLAGEKIHRHPEGKDPRDEHHRPLPAE